MAEQKKKKTAAAGGTSGSKASKGAAKRPSKSSASGKNARAAAARARVEENRRRRRRAWAAGILLCLGVFTFLGYFNSDGVVIRFLRGLMTGLFGGGFYLLPPMLILAAALLALFPGEHQGGRAWAAACVPLLVSAFCQLFSRTGYSLSFKMFASLWADGKNLTGGG